MGYIKPITNYDGRNQLKLIIEDARLSFEVKDIANLEIEYDENSFELIENKKDSEYVIELERTNKTFILKLVFGQDVKVSIPKDWLFSLSLKLANVELDLNKLILKQLDIESYNGDCKCNDLTVKDESTLNFRKCNMRFNNCSFLNLNSKIESTSFKLNNIKANNIVAITEKSNIYVNNFQANTFTNNIKNSNANYSNGSLTVFTFDGENNVLNLEKLTSITLNFDTNKSVLNQNEIVATDIIINSKNDTINLDSVKANSLNLDGQNLTLNQSGIDIKEKIVKLHNGVINE